MKTDDNKSKLKIELRSVVYGGGTTYRCLEYRFCENQDLSYKKNHSWLFGLIKFNTTCHYDTDWHQPQLFVGYSPENNESYYLNWSPLYIDSDYNNSGLTLVKCKNMFKTYGDLANYVNATGNKNYEKFQKERVKYLEFQKPRY